MSANERTTQTPGATPEPSRGLNTDGGTTPSNGVRLAELEAFKARSSVFGASPDALDVLRLAMEEWRARAYAAQARAESLLGEISGLQRRLSGCQQLLVDERQKSGAEAQSLRAEVERLLAACERHRRIEGELKSERDAANALLEGASRRLARADHPLWWDSYDAHLSGKPALSEPDAYYADLAARLKGKDGP